MEKLLLKLYESAKDNIQVIRTLKILAVQNHLFDIASDFRSRERELIEENEEKCFLNVSEMWVDFKKQKPNYRGIYMVYGILPTPAKRCTVFQAQWDAENNAFYDTDPEYGLDVLDNNILFWFDFSQIPNPNL